MRLPLLTAQSGVWFAQQMEPESAVYNGAQYLEIRGRLDVARFAAAVRTMVLETDSLHARFAADDDGLHQVVSVPDDWSLPVLDRSADEAIAWMERDRATPLVLGEDVLFAQALFRVGEQRFLWYQRTHHIVMDAYGMWLMTRRVAELYAGEASAVTGSIAALVAEEQAYRAESAADREHWHDVVRDLPEQLSPARGSAPPRSDFVRCHGGVDAATFDALRQVAATFGTKWPAVVLAAAAAHLHRVTGMTDVVLGFPVTGRTTELTRGFPAMMVNVLPVRLSPRHDMRFGELVHQAGQCISSALRHQRYRGEDLRREFGLTGDQENFFTLEVDFMPFDHRFAFGDCEVTPHLLHGSRVKDLMFAVYHHHDGTGLRIDFYGNPDLYEEEQLAGHGTVFETLLREVATGADPVLEDIRIAELPDESTGPLVEVPDVSAAALFRERARRHPDRLAVVSRDGELTYAELDRRSDVLARVLAERGAGSGDIVALRLRRGAGFVVAWLATLKSGAAYLPIDPDYPPSRIDFMLADAAPAVVLTDRDLTATTGSIVDIPDPRPDSAAYVIYTSGSSGRPKAVVVEHRSLTNIAVTLGEYSTASATAWVTSASFDMSLKALTGLCRGTTLHVLSDDVRLDAHRCVEHLRRHGVGLIPCTPGYLAPLADAGLLDLTLDVWLGGEPIPPALWSRLREAPTVRALNMYGPTEATVDATTWWLRDSETVTIGRPMANARTYVLDAAGKPVPPGVIGEIHIGGAGVARGYLDRPELTAHRFPGDPFGEPGGRMYRTGDLAWWDSRGVLRFAGRVDGQVKVRGFRVELGEVEAALTSSAGVSRTVVVVRDERLVAYVVGTASGLADHAARVLPAHMVPSVFVELDVLPLTPNGKLDRAALPAPGTAGPNTRAPADEVERLLCGLFGEVLNVPETGPDDDFLTIGGDSIACIRLVGRAHRAGLALTVREIFQHRTPAALARVARAARASSGVATGPLSPTPIMLERAEHAGAYCQAVTVRVPESLTEDTLTRAWQAILDHHDVLRLRDGVILPRGQVDAAADVARTDDLDAEPLEVSEGLTFRLRWSPREARLLIVLRHEVTDGVSWRILLPDLESAWQAIDAGRPPLLPPAGTPLREWTRRLAESAHSPERLAELPWWKEVLAGPRFCDSELVPAVDTTGTARSLTTTLPRPSVPDNEINDVLLAALGRAIGRPVVVNLESHGRHDLFDHVDVSRTLGWFTSRFPVLLDPGRGVVPPPDHGVGYGMLRHLNADTAAVLAALPQPQIGYNYLGRFEAREDCWTPVGALRSAASPTMPLLHHVELEIVAREQRLEVTWRWAGRLVGDDEIRTLAGTWALHVAEATRTAGHDVLALTPLQRGLLYQAQLDGPVHDAYVVQVGLELHGALDVPRLRAAAAESLRRHPQLGAVFRHRGLDQPVQLVPHEPVLHWQEIDESEMDSERAAVADPAAAPALLRFALVRLAGDRHRLVVTNHHLLLDGWSRAQLLRELFALYEGATLPPAVSHRAHLEWLDTRDEVADREAWRAALSGLGEPTLLAPGRAAGPVAELTAELPVPSVPGVTPNTVLQVAWGLALTVHTGRDDVVFGTVVSGRPPTLPGADTMVGLFINTVPVRFTAHRHEPLADVLTRHQDAQSALMDHHQLSLAEIQLAAGLGALFDTLVVFENYPFEPEDLGPLVADITTSEATHYPVCLVVVPGPRLRVRLQYRTAVIDRSRAQAMLDLLQRALTALTGDRSVPAGQVGVPTRELSYLDRLDITMAAIDSVPVTLPNLVEATVARHPDAIALVSATCRLTYAELDARANRLAHELVERGVGPETIVGLRLPRSAEMIIAVLAVTKAGGAYLPLDPSYPPERLQFMIGDADPVLVLTDVDAPERPDTPPRRHITTDNAAYVIYTSGSTGAPKGVVVPHRGLNALATALRARLHLSPGARVLQFSSPSFDAAVMELLMALTSGATLVIPPPGPLAGEALATVLRSRAITHALIPPTALATVAPGAFPDLETLVVGGEACPQSLVDAWAPGRRMVNAYGPTEATVCTTLSLPLCRGEQPPIGHPVPGTRCHVMDSDGHPVPDGVVGELYLGGVSVARGYLGRPELTRERFVPDPYHGGVMYRTGDLVRRRPDGQLVFAGRADEQVKIRGFRIEPGEVAALVAGHPDVAGAAVVARTVRPGDQRLVAYVVPSGPELSISDLRDHVAGRAPNHLVPSAFVVVPALPTTPNGKLDTASLPVPQFGSARPASSASAAERNLCRIFAEVLGCTDVGVDDSFFDLGGHSLLLPGLQSLVAGAFGEELPLLAFFEHPTVRRLARRLGTGAAEPPMPDHRHRVDGVDRTARARSARLRRRDDGRPR